MVFFLDPESLKNKFQDKELLARGLRQALTENQDILEIMFRGPMQVISAQLGKKYYERERHSGR